MKFSCAFLTLATSLLVTSVGADCPHIEVQQGFDLDEYISAPWYVQQQAEVQYLPLEDFFCVRAEYSLVNERGLFGRRRTTTRPWFYSINVNNQAQDEAGNEKGGRLCAYQRGPEEAKLAVAPCFLPKFFAGDYWVVLHDEAEGYALVSGGQPTEESSTNPGKCAAGDGINNSGLWIFTREQQRNDTLVEQVRGLADGLGFDLDVLYDVDQTNCDNRRRVL
eukprot:CAMPEP_0168775838 /NCGR_PEP_ID=MMETSP0725-20121227/5723_1 /TAXON_ID=265536 /ORGANISM="Amphiprora sp., Strain CCMP467" /LENGTH=220 /DNA_ID=CAMNT_0008825489 /DNA_START=61 /DNA_END=720 /DNA_ORIENTATION=+